MSIEYGYSEMDLNNVVSVKFKKFDGSLNYLEEIEINDSWMEYGENNRYWKVEATSEGGFNGFYPLNEFVEKIVSAIKDGYSWEVIFTVDAPNDLSGIIEDGTGLKVSDRGGYMAIIQAVKDKLEWHGQIYWHNIKPLVSSTEYNHAVIGTVLDESNLKNSVAEGIEFGYSLEGLISDIAWVKALLGEYLTESVPEMEYNGLLVNIDGVLDTPQLEINAVSEKEFYANKEEINMKEFTYINGVAEGIEFYGGYNPTDKGYINPNDCPISIYIDIWDKANVKETFKVLVDLDGRMAVDGINSEQFPRWISKLEDYEIQVSYNQSYSGRKEIEAFLKECKGLNPELLWDIMDSMETIANEYVLGDIKHDSSKCASANFYDSLRLLRNDIKDFYETLNEYVNDFTDTFDEYCYVNSEGLYDYNFNM